jgi:hypothetical protein
VIVISQLSGWRINISVAMFVRLPGPKGAVQGGRTNAASLRQALADIGKRASKDF